MVSDSHLRLIVSFKTALSNLASVEPWAACTRRAVLPSPAKSAMGFKAVHEMDRPWIPAFVQRRTFRIIYLLGALV